MSYNFSEWLREQLFTYDGFNFELVDEQDFIKMTQFEPDKVYVVVKMLTDSKIFNNASTQPIQIMILCSENDVPLTKSVFNDIATKWNMQGELKNGTFVKFSFTNVVDMSNFNEDFNGYKSILYTTCSLYIMDGIVDITDLKIDDVSIDSLGFNLAYNMSPDTQQLPNVSPTEYIAKSVKSTSGLVIALTFIPTSGTLLTKLTGILNETNTGNEDFKVYFKIGTVEITKNMKLSSLTNPDNAVIASFTFFCVI